jgi:hypothetical protein
MTEVATPIAGVGEAPGVRGSIAENQVTLSSGQPAPDSSSAIAARRSGRLARLITMQYG